MTSSMAAALLLTMEITGESPSVSEIVSPQRFSPRELAKTAAMGAKAVKYIGKRLFQIPKSTVRDLKPGHGAVVRTAAGKMGVYRDEEGKFHAVSPPLSPSWLSAFLESGRKKLGLPVPRFPV